MVAEKILARGIRFIIMHRGQEFNSFEEVDSKINELFAQGHHPLRIFNSQSAEDSNRKRAKADSVLTPIDVAKWRYAYISYRCVYSYQNFCQINHTFKIANMRKIIYTVTCENTIL